MIRTPSGWQHEGKPCEWEGFFRGERQPCRHIKECQKLVNENAPTTQAVVLSNTNIVEFDRFASDTAAGPGSALQQASVDVIHTWCYGFNQGDGNVIDLSIKGVQAVAREMAKKGEVIKPVSIEVVAEDDYEVRVICTAVREVVQVIDGVVVRIELDRAIRGKRQTKEMEVNVWERRGERNVKVGTTMKPDKFWYEKAVSKAVRNAMAPLLGGEARAQVIGLWGQAERILGNRVLPPARPEETKRYLPGVTPPVPAPPPPAPPAPPAPPENKGAPAQNQQPTQQNQPPSEADHLPVTPALRQQINRKFTEMRTSLSGADQKAAVNAFFAVFPECKPLQGEGIILNKVDTIGRAKLISAWLNAKITGEAPPLDAEDDTGLEGAQGNVQLQGEVNAAVQGEFCPHPDEELSMHPEKADTYVCGICKTEIVMMASNDN